MKYKCAIFNRSEAPNLLEEDINDFFKDNDIEIIHYKQSSTGRIDTTVTISIIYKDNDAVTL